MPTQIRELRVSRYLTQAELAEQVGVTEEAIANWENGRRAPRFRHRRKLAEILGVEPGDIQYPVRSLKPSEADAKTS